MIQNPAIYGGSAGDIETVTVKNPSRTSVKGVCLLDGVLCAANLESSPQEVVKGSALAVLIVSDPVKFSPESAVEYIGEGLIEVDYHYYRVISNVEITTNIIS